MHAAPAAPTGLGYTGLQNRSFTLQWDELPNRERCDPSFVYSVKVAMEGDNTPRLIESNTTNTYTVITGLCPHCLYSISVRACTNTMSCGQYSGTIQIHTLEDGM